LSTGVGKVLETRSCKKNRFLFSFLWHICEWWLKYYNHYIKNWNFFSWNLEFYFDCNIPLQLLVRFKTQIDNYWRKFLFLCNKNIVLKKLQIINLTDKKDPPYDQKWWKENLSNLDSLIKENFSNLLICLQKQKRNIYLNISFHIFGRFLKKIFLHHICNNLE
jgi:hypothetical protein